MEDGPEYPNSVFYAEIGRVYDELVRRNKNLQQKGKKQGSKHNSLLDVFQRTDFAGVTLIYQAVSERLIVVTIFSPQAKKWVFRCVHTYRDQADTRWSDLNVLDVFGIEDKDPLLDCIGYHFFDRAKLVCLGIEYYFKNGESSLARELCLTTLRYSKKDHTLQSIGSSRIPIPDIWANLLPTFAAKHRVFITETQLKFTEKKSRIYSLYRPWSQQPGVFLIHCFFRKAFHPIASRGTVANLPEGLVMFNPDTFLIDSFVASRNNSTSLYLASWTHTDRSRNATTSYKIYRLDLQL